jgi:hypothetical protein
MAAICSVASGLIGGCVWLVDLEDRADGDDLRWGFWHNPFMQFTPISEPLLDASMWVLFACSAAAGLGGLMLLVACKWGVPLVTWQARVSMMTNGIVVFFIALIAFGVVEGWWTWKALSLRLGSIAVNLLLLIFLSSNAVQSFFNRKPQSPARSHAKAAASMTDNPYAPPRTDADSEYARQAVNDRDRGPATWDPSRNT